MLPRNKAQSAKIGGRVIYCCGASGDSATEEKKKTFIHSGILVVHLLITDIQWSPNSRHPKSKEKLLLVNLFVGHSELKTESPVFPSTLFYISEALSSDYLCQQMRRFRNTNTQIYFPYEY